MVCGSRPIFVQSLLPFLCKHRYATYINYKLRKRINLPVRIAHRRDWLRYRTIHGVESPVERKAGCGRRGRRGRGGVPPLAPQFLFPTPLRSSVGEPDLLDGLQVRRVVEDFCGVLRSYGNVKSVYRNVIVCSDYV